jgi:hypothetical protein
VGGADAVATRQNDRRRMHGIGEAAGHPLYRVPDRRIRQPRVAAATVLSVCCLSVSCNAWLQSFLSPQPGLLAFLPQRE